LRHTTHVQSNLAKGRIVDSSPLAAANAFRSRPLADTWFLGSTSVSPKRHLDRFNRFCTAHQCAQHTDTQTTLRSNRTHLCTACRRYAA